MARLADFPIEAPRDFLRGLLDRTLGRDATYRVELYLTVEDGRLFWAAERHLEVYETIGRGIELTDFTLAQVRRRLGELVAEIRMQAEGQEIVLRLSPRDILILKDAELHLDRYAIQSIPPLPKTKKR